MPPPDIHEIDKVLTAHLAECAQQNKQVWHELKSLKRIVWAAAVAGYAVLGAICGVLLKNHLHL